MIRRATTEDIPQLLVMGEQFAAYAPFDVAYSPEGTSSALASLIEVGVVLVAEIDSEIVGGLAGLAMPFWYAPLTKVATEIAWWVAPDHRGGRTGVSLVKAFEAWAKENGASVVSLCDMCIDGGYPAGSLFGRMGYQMVERTHMKEI